MKTLVNFFVILFFVALTSCGGGSSGSQNSDNDSSSSDVSSQEFTNDEEFLLNGYVDEVGEIETSYLEATINYDKTAYSSSDEIENLPAIGHVSDKMVVLYCGPGKQTPSDADMVTECADNSESHLYWWCNENGGSVGYSYDAGIIYTHTYSDGATFGYVSCNGDTFSYGFGNFNEFDDSVTGIQEIVDSGKTSATYVDDNLANYEGTYYTEKDLMPEYASCEELTGFANIVDIAISVDSSGNVTSALYIYGGLENGSLDFAELGEESVSFTDEVSYPAGSSSDCVYLFYTAPDEDGENANYLHRVCTLESQTCDDYYFEYEDSCEFNDTCSQTSSEGADTEGDGYTHVCALTTWGCGSVIPHGSYIDTNNNYFEY